MERHRLAWGTICLDDREVVTPSGQETAVCIAGRRDPTVLAIADEFLFN